MKRKRLLARCPRTGRWLSTGVEMSEDVFARIATVESRVFCPDCAMLHPWTGKDALLTSPSDSFVESDVA